jgi:photosystem II stability/assembly factor-like uncharacterized protein
MKSQSKKVNKLLLLATTNGLRVLERQERSWIEIEHALASHHVTSIAAAGHDILAGTPEGVFHSEDTGRTWMTANEGLVVPHVRWLAYHPDGSRVFAGAEPAAIFVSHDRARTWRECREIAKLRDENKWYLPYSPEAGCVRGFAFNGERGYAAVEQGGLLRSDDHGGTWRLTDASAGNPRSTIPQFHIHPDVHSVEVHPSSPDLVFAPTGGGLYLSEDGGMTYREIYDCYCRAVWIDPDDADHLIFGPADSVSEDGRIEETRDGGESWGLLSAGLDTPWPRRMIDRFVQVDDELLAILSDGHVLITSLHDLTWHWMEAEVEDVLAAAVMER